MKILFSTKLSQSFFQNQNILEKEFERQRKFIFQDYESGLPEVPILFDFVGFSNSFVRFFLVKFVFLRKQSKRKI